MFPVAALGLALLGWQLVALIVMGVRGAPFPTPVETLLTLWRMLMGKPFLDHSIYTHTIDSLGRWSGGFLLGAAGGTLLGMACGRWLVVERLLMPSLHVLQLIPGLAWVPVAILTFGLGSGATLFMISMTAFAPIAISVAGGVKRVDEMYIRAARMLGLRNQMLFFRILMPGALPHILSGFRTGLGSSWRVLVAAEMVIGSGTGLGYAMLQSRWTLDYAGAFVCIAVIALIGLIVERCVFVPLEQRTVELWGLKKEV